MDDSSSNCLLVTIIIYTWDHTISHHYCLYQMLLAIPFTAALCDLFYTIDQGRRNSTTVASFQYISPSIIAVSMVFQTMYLCILQNIVLSHLIGTIMYHTTKWSSLGTPYFHTDVSLLVGTRCLWHTKNENLCSHHHTSSKTLALLHPLQY